MIINSIHNKEGAIRSLQISDAETIRKLHTPCTF